LREQEAAIGQFPHGEQGREVSGEFLAGRTHEPDLGRRLGGGGGTSERETRYRNSIH
jgi:hypothetical protein